MAESGVTGKNSERRNHPGAGVTLYRTQSEGQKPPAVDNALPNAEVLKPPAILCPDAELAASR